jgi:hypothetical protein
VETEIQLINLWALHPRLYWDTIILAAGAVFREGGREPPHPFILEVENVPGFGSGSVHFLFDPTGLALDAIERVRRTFESSRLIEMAAIAVAAAALSHAGGHTILDIAGRGTAADYVIDHARHHLEIAGRSRRVDLEAAWEQKWQRLGRQRRSGCYVCISEFETLTARLGFADPESGQSHADANSSSQ